MLRWLEANDSGEAPKEEVIPPKEEVEPIPEEVEPIPPELRPEIQVPDPDEPDKDYANETASTICGNEWLAYLNAINRMLNTVIKGYQENKDLPGYPREEAEDYLRAKAEYEVYKKSVLNKN